MARGAADSLLFELPEEPDDFFERRAKRRGARLVVGVDEVGRGPLAGPVVTAAVCFERGRVPDGVNDSKKLTAAERERLYEAIAKVATISVAVAGPARIDRMNILRASLWAMSRAVAALACKADYVLVDGNMLPPGLPCPAEAIVSGDARSCSIAAASIVAKVTRDRLMTAIGNTLPAYGFGNHMGYSTPEHLEALKCHGATAHHRRSFAPVREALGLAPLADAAALVLPGLD
ncbi:MAG: ribonuclease HII [Bauldia sp.]